MKTASAFALCCLAALPAPGAVPPANAEPADGAAVARIGTQPISAAELQSQAAAALGAQQRQYELQKRQLDVNFARARQTLLDTELGKLVDARVLDLEAAAAGSTPARLMEAVKPPAVGEAQVRAYYEARKEQIGQPYEGVAELIRRHLQSQADENSKRRYLDGLRAKYAATVSLEPPREEVAATGPSRGAADAKVTLVEFSDFECPFCGRFTPVVAQLLAAYPGELRVVYRYFPLNSIHPEAQKAAEAAACADAQGRFWPMHDALFADQSALGVPQLKATAARLGLDTQRFDGCLDGGAAAAVVAADQAAGEDLAVGSTPSSFLNGRYVKGALSVDQMKAMIDDELSRQAPARLTRRPP